MTFKQEIDQVYILCLRFRHFCGIIKAIHAIDNNSEKKGTSSIPSKSEAPSTLCRPLSLNSPVSLFVFSDLEKSAFSPLPGDVFEQYYKKVLNVERMVRFNKLKGPIFPVVHLIKELILVSSPSVTSMHSFDFLPTF